MKLKFIALKEARKAKGIKQQDFAKEIGISKPTVYRWEGRYTGPKKDEHILQAIDLLGQPFEDLFYVELDNFENQYFFKK